MSGASLAPGIALPQPGRRPRPQRGAAPTRLPRRSPRAPADRGGQGLVLGALATLLRLSQHRLLDRLIRGRLWIGLVAFALIGIVAMQLLILQLNTGIGRALERQAYLERANARLSIEDATNTAGSRVESQAARDGMVLAPVGALRFLDARDTADVGRAAVALRSPVHKPTASTTASSTTGTSSEGTAAAGEAGTPASSAGQSSSPGETPAASASSEAAGSGASGATSAGSGEASSTATAPSSTEAASNEPSSPARGPSGTSAQSEAPASTPSGGTTGP